MTRGKEMMNQEERGRVLAAANLDAVPVDLGLGPIASLSVPAAGATHQEQNRQTAADRAWRSRPGLPSIETVLASPETSFWLRQALETALARDPMDAATDAALLAALLGQLMDALLGQQLDNVLNR